MRKVESLGLPLTLTLSPLKSGERGHTYWVGTILSPS
jgi:hypothetical protein